MEKKRQYDKWTSEQLLRQVKQLKLGTALPAGILLLLFALTIYNSIKKREIDPLLITPIALSVVIPINILKIGKIKAEIERREQKQ